MKIEDFISTGRKNAVSQSDIAKMCNIPERAVRKEVETARISRGALIVGDESGYYFPSDIADIRAYVARTKARISTARKALVPFLRALKGAENGKSPVHSS